VTRGIGSESLLWYRSEARCLRCTRRVTHHQGIFCANFGQQAPGLLPCQNVWCATCFKILPGADFLIYRPSDDTGEELCAPGEERDFLEARPGDHLFCPFECDYCAFYRLRGHLPLDSDPIDQRLLVYIRRANLDAFWARRPGTIYGLNRLFKEQVEVGELFGFTMFDSLGPFSRNYNSGMKAAIGILSRSQRQGQHEAKMKYSSVRKARSLHTDFYNASAKGVEGTLVWRSDRARFVATEAPTDSAWFNCFMTGFKARVGERRKQDAAIPIALMVALQLSLEQEWAEATIENNQADLRNLAEHGAFYLFLYCGSLRGFEGTKIVLTDLRRQIATPGSTSAILYGAHIGLPLVGRFKARSQDSRNILIPVAYETASKLQPGVWAERLIKTLENEGIRTGWAFQDALHEQLKMSHFEEDFYERLLRIQQLQPDLFPDGINILEDFHLARSFRRGATTRATVAGVSGTDIDWINRWNIGADASGSGPMRVLYTDRIQLTKLFLRFSLAL
jgi:hypothetical protein